MMVTVEEGAIEPMVNSHDEVKLLWMCSGQCLLQHSSKPGKHRLQTDIHHGTVMELLKVQMTVLVERGLID